MKILFSLLVGLICVTTGFFTYSNPLDDFINKFYKLTGMQLQNVFSYKGLNGYTMPVFEDKDATRNHFEGNIGTIKYLILHNTEETLLNTVKIFTSDLNQDPSARPVRVHYVVTETEKDSNIEGGTIISFAPENIEVYHCGDAVWQNDGLDPKVRFNYFALGIEFINLSNYNQRFPFDPKQIDAGGKLISEIVKTHNINPTHLLSHGDIAFPPRKIDPTEFFPWGYLYAKYNVGAWITENDFKTIDTQAVPSNPDIAFMSKYMRMYGYNVPEINNVLDDAAKSEQFLWGLLAFKAHFSENQSPKYKETLDFWLSVKANNKMSENINKIPEYITLRDMKWIYCLVTKYKKYL